jgi:hypothetical protein
MCAPFNATLPPLALHASFLAILPRIEHYGRIYFRHLRCSDRKADAIEEMRALAWSWYVRLAQCGKDASQFVTSLAIFAARAVNSGRRLAGMEKAKDVMNPATQRRHGFRVESLPTSTCASHEDLYAAPHGQELHDAFEERLRDNTLTPVPEQAAFRIDFSGWLATLSDRERHIVCAMAQNERTKDLSQRFKVSSARISQIRRELQDAWSRFCGQEMAVA